MVGLTQWTTDELFYVDYSELKWYELLWRNTCCVFLYTIAASCLISLPILTQIISLYPHYLPTNANFTRSVPPLHEIADINQLSKSDEQVKAAYKHFLQSFLEDIRGTNLAHGYKRVSVSSSY